MKFVNVQGHCPICGDKFFDICEGCNRPTDPLPNHRQFKVMLSNGTEAQIGVCEKEISRMNIETAQAIWEGIADYLATAGADYSGVRVTSIELTEDKKEVTP